MTTATRDLDYPVHITKSCNGFRLSINELLLFVECKNLPDGYDRIQKRKQEMVQEARETGLLSELPAPLPLPRITSPLREPTRLLAPLRA